MIKIGYDPKYDYDERFTQAEPSDVKEHGIFYDCENKMFRLRCPRCGCVVEGKGEDVTHYGVGSYGGSRYIDVTCPECGGHMDDHCVVWTREKNEDVAVETFDAIEQAKKNIVEAGSSGESKDGEVDALEKLLERRIDYDTIMSTYVTAEQLNRREEYYDTTHYLHITRHVLSNELSYGIRRRSLAQRLYDIMLGNPNCGGVVFGNMAPVEVMMCDLGKEIVNLCVEKGKVVIFNPSDIFKLGDE